MKKELELVLSPEKAQDIDFQKDSAAHLLQIASQDISQLRLLKRSIDSRYRQIKIRLLVEVIYNEAAPPESLLSHSYPQVKDRKSVLIIGAGPAGLFAALRLIELGYKPVIIERGKDVKSRRRDLAAINKMQIVNPDSNYCFGEGGAGTYSDGKLYTRASKRGNVRNILNLFVAHGAAPDILIDAHPHIGTNKLPGIIAAMRETILNAGGEIHFNCRLTELLIINDTIKGIYNQHGDLYEGEGVILATGHSARDIYELLNRKNILLEAKPFAMGLRVEHPQLLIDTIQYHCSPEEVTHQRLHLPAASYSLVEQVKGRGVFSFCMCPGGIIAPCATAPGEIVSNGWSPSKRNNPFANSGIVVAIDPAELPGQKPGNTLADPLIGLHFQRALEQKAFLAANPHSKNGNGQIAPAQRMLDFVNNKISATLPLNSYQPGLASLPLHDLLPRELSVRLQAAFGLFGKKMKGYYTNEAVLVGVESRTSTPVRIPRDKNTLQHPQIKRLYPCGEGAGYAGGIVSAAMDGVACAEAIVSEINNF
jgi:uncharacterized FAD-dependent dehydrogenase